MNVRTAGIRAAALFAASALLVTTTGAQQPRPGAGTGGQASQVDAPASAPRERAALREFVDRRIDAGREALATLERARAMLEAGAPVADVRPLLREAMRQGAPGFGQDVAGDFGRDPGPDMRPERRPPDADRPPPEFTEERAEEFLETLAELNPRLHERIVRMRERDPEEARRALARIAPRLAEFLQLRRDDPERFRIRGERFRATMESHRLHRLIAEARASGAPAEHVEALEAQLREQVARRFDLEIADRAAELAALERRLVEMRADVERQQEARDLLIEDRVKQMLSAPPPAGGERGREG